jgi:hypothetical protein
MGVYGIAARLERTNVLPHTIGCIFQRDDKLMSSPVLNHAQQIFAVGLLIKMVSLAHSRHKVVGSTVHQLIELSETTYGIVFPV